MRSRRPRPRRAGRRLPPRLPRRCDPAPWRWRRPATGLSTGPCGICRHWRASSAAWPRQNPAWRRGLPAHPRPRRRARGDSHRRCAGCAQGVSCSGWGPWSRWSLPRSCIPCWPPRRIRRTSVCRARSTARRTWPRTPSTPPQHVRWAAARITTTIWPSHGSTRMSAAVRCCWRRPAASGVTSAASRRLRACRRYWAGQAGTRPSGVGTCWRRQGRGATPPPPPGPPPTAPREAAPEAPSAPGMLPPAWNLESLGDRLAAFGRTSAARLRRLTVEQWLWIGVIALAFFLRFWNLGAKPLHHDESMHAYFSLLFAQHPETYAYDPLLHGPFQFHAEGFMFALLLALQHIFAAGASGNPWINDTTARFVPALFGVGIVALPFRLRREPGRGGALLSAFLVAVSPSFVYFSRFLREDIYFNFFMFAMVVAALRYAHQRTLWRFILLVAATILAYATFEGTFLALAVFGSFLAVLCVWDLGPSFARLLPTTFTPRERLFFSRARAVLLLW